MERAAKEALVAEMKDIFSNSVAAVLVDYRGLTVNEVVELRKKLNGASARIKVLKNTLSKIAAKDTVFEEISEQFSDTRALVYSYDNQIEQIKVINDYAKENKKFKVKLGLVVEKGKGTLFKNSQLEALAKLPPREELVAKLLFLFNAPVTNFVRTLNEVPAKFVRALSAVADSKNQQ